MKKEDSVATSIVDTAYHIHNNLGPGLLESVYERVLAYELRKRGHTLETQVAVPLFYDGHTIDEAFKADMIIDDCVIVELKSLETLQLVHSKQLLTYLRLANKKLGLLINFGAPLIKQGIQRVANGL
ncbi:MAG: GxxExxY protein [Gammaproteobacteria bacterium]|uniref:GxxExxY protein n=1 Tax=Candidatus Thiopontia autotrophica TaxID=2841688 RepID=A0A8J6PA94_9GAMM|nr:GxxExxY protein [Candidatus Thiopontia autotrophica]